MRYNAMHATMPQKTEITRTRGEGRQGRHPGTQRHMPSAIANMCGPKSREKHCADVKSELCYLWTLRRMRRHGIETVEEWSRGVGNEEVLDEVLCDYSSSCCFD
jgi:hypothetical protein